MSRLAVLPVLLLLGVVVLGCSQQEFRRPALRKPITVLSDLLDSGKPYLEPGKSPAQQRMERLAQTLAAWQAEAPREAAGYHIGPADVLDVGIFALEEPDKTTTLSRTVSQDGFITLPWVGSVPAVGLSARGLEATIKEAYAGRYIKDPQVTVTVTEYRSAAVVVTGAVGKPGVYYLTSSRSTVLSMLAQAGGLTEEAGDELLVIRSGNPRRSAGNPRGSPAGQPPAVELVPGRASSNTGLARQGAQTAGKPKAIAIDLKELVDQGNLLLNLPVASGDIVTVPPRAEQYVYVLGYVQRPGAYEIKDGVRVNALRAVALAGGLTPSSRAENSLLLRETAGGQKVVPVDLTKIARGVRPPLYMEPGDTLIVGSSAIAKMTEFIRPTVSAGVQMSAGQ